MLPFISPSFSLLSSLLFILIPPLANDISKGSFNYPTVRAAFAHAYNVLTSELLHYRNRASFAGLPRSLLNLILRWDPAAKAKREALLERIASLGIGLDAPADGEVEVAPPLRHYKEVAPLSRHQREVATLPRHSSSVFLPKSARSFSAPPPPPPKHARRDSDSDGGASTRKKPRFEPYVNLLMDDDDENGDSSDAGDELTRRPSVMSGRRAQMQREFAGVFVDGPSDSESESDSRYGRHGFGAKGGRGGAASRGKVGRGGKANKWSD